MTQNPRPASIKRRILRAVPLLLAAMWVYLERPHGIQTAVVVGIGVITMLVTDFLLRLSERPSPPRSSSQAD